jgi:hypothetical protein
MARHGIQCLYCGYLLDCFEDVCPVFRPHSEVADHAKRDVAMAHERGRLLRAGAGGVIVREADLYDGLLFFESDVRSVLLRIEEDGEIERFNGHYRVVRPPDPSD